MAEVRLKLSSPWVTYVNKLMALFGPDPDLRIEYVYDESKVKFYVDNPEKAEALEYLLPSVKNFGNYTLYIDIIPANKPKESYNNFRNIQYLFDTAFDRNPVYAFTYVAIGLYSNPMYYVVFKNRVVQFFNDNLNDIHGNISTLYQDIAEEIFDDNDSLPSIFYNTDIEEKIDKPLGEWP